MSRPAPFLPRYTARRSLLSWSIILLGLGVTLRVFQFLVDRWVSAEAAAPALDTLARAPAGNDLALHLVSLLIALAGLLVFYRLAQRLLPSPGACVAVALFALSGSLVFYTTQHTTPYALDVLVVLVLYAATLWAGRRRFEPTAMVALSALGAVALWVSYPAILILTGIGIVLTLDALARDARTRLRHLGAAVGVWLLSFGLYASIGPGVPGADTAHGPVGLFGAALAGAPLGAAGAPVGWFLVGVAALCFAGGVRAMWWGERRLLALLITPMLVTGLAIAVGLYPQGGRELLFLAPPAMLIAAAGAADIQRATARMVPELGVAVIALLLIYPALAATHKLATGTPFG